MMHRPKRPTPGVYATRSEPGAIRTSGQPTPPLLSGAGVALEVGSDRPLRLEGRRAWWVESGRVDVFLLSMRHGRAAGSRKHLFSVDSGRLLFSTAPEAGGADRLGLLAVGTQGTCLRAIEETQLHALASNPEAVQTVSELLDEWVDLLTGSVLAHDLRHRFLEAEPGSELTLEPGTKVRPRQRVGWVRHEAGRSLLLGQQGLDVNGYGFTPVSRRAWLDVAQESRLTWAETSELLPGGEAWTGLAHLHALIMSYTARLAEQAADAERDRLRQRAAAGRSAFTEACSHLAAALDPKGSTRKRTIPVAGDRSDGPSADALFAACRLVGQAMGVSMQRPREQDGEVAADAVAAIARSSRIRIRQVMLRDEWWKQDGGPFLAFTESERRPVALLPLRADRYALHDCAEGTTQVVDEELAGTLDPRAHGFYRHFPDERLTLGRVIRFGLHRCGRDLWMVVGMGVSAALLSLVTPVATGMVFNDIIPGAARPELFQLTVILLVIAVSSSLFNVVSGIAILRVEARTGSSIQAAIWDRLLSLPMPFFRPFAAGNLAERAMSIEAIRQVLSGATISALLGGIFSLFHFGLLFHYSVKLAWWATLLIAIAVLVACLGGYVQLKHQRRIFHLQAKISGSVLQFLSSVAKLRIAGAEVHAFARWAETFSEQRRLQYAARTVGNLVASFNGMFPVAASIVIYATAMPLLTSSFTLMTGDFLAFTASFATCLTSTLGATTALLSTLTVVPLYEQAKPILVARPEVDTAKADPGRLTGHVEIQNAVFRYHPEGPPVLRNLSLEVQPGEFAALVGPSGSGKSTVLRLLLRFEEPESGAIYYDGKDLNGLDVREVRNQIGVVLQNGRLMPGDIFTNIIGSSPLTLDDAWQAARMAGLDKDIESMPMGMHTVVSEGGGTLSGGQRQRLMIARALVRRPRLLFFDEATSALDNRTQAIVSESLDRLQSARIVVAHRLSTIMHADRIYVLEAGAIVQAGTYEQLLAEPGLFAELAERQLA